MVFLRYKPKVAREAAPALADAVEIADPRFYLDLPTVGKLGRLRLSRDAQIVLSLPLTIDPTRKAIVPVEAGQAVSVSRLQGYYYGASLPRETAPSFYNLAIDPNHRLYVIDDQVLAKVNAIFNSIGDAGTNPSNASGATALFYLHYINRRFSDPASAETFTSTPLAANAAYYGPVRDFAHSRLAAMGVMGYADQPSATDGVYIQLSIDGSNWDYRGATATLSAAGAVSLCQVVTARYARAVWVNGATAQTAFRFGGRYMIAGSENPPLSPVVDYPETAVCSVCNADLTEAGDFFAEKDPETGRWIVYCSKCYANKRWKEITDTKPWLRGLKAWAKAAEDKARVKAHTPDAVETEVV